MGLQKLKKLIRNPLLCLEYIKLMKTNAVKNFMLDSELETFIKRQRKFLDYKNTSVGASNYT